MRVPDLTSLARSISTKSVLNPLLYLTFLTLVGAISAGGLGLPIALELGYAAIGCIAFSVAAYTFWSFREPGRLQSETHHEEMRRIELMLDERIEHSRRPTIDVTPTENRHVGGG